MENTLRQIINILVIPPGNLIFHLVSAFAIMAAIQAVIITRQPARSLTSRRFLLGLSMMILIQIALSILSGLGWQGVANLPVLLPPVDRAAALASLLLIIWMWAFPLPAKTWDATFLILVILSTAAAIYTLSIWNTDSSKFHFNGTIFDQSWEVVTIIASLAGIVLIAFRHPQGWGVGLGILVVNLLGHAVQVLWPDISGDLAGPVRLAQLCSYPLLPSLARFLVASNSASLMTHARAPSSQAAPGQFRERRKHSADPRTVQAWLQLALPSVPQKAYFNLNHAIAQTMLADLSLLVSVPNQQNDINVLGGYDLIRENELPPFQIFREKVPLLASAISRGRPILLGDEIAPAPDLQELASSLKLEDCGNLLFIPLATPESNYGGVILLTPYSNRVWSEDDQSYLLTSVRSIVTFLQNLTPSSIPGTIPVFRRHDASLEQELAAMRQQVEVLRGDNQVILNELATVREEKRIDHDLSSGGYLQHLQMNIKQLKEENQRLEAELNAYFPVVQSEKSPEVEHLEKELRHTLEESARFQNALADANMQILMLQKRANQPVRMVNEDREVIASIIQELRQPMATITGYTELILSESAGILGTMQHKLLDRVKVSSDRMRTMLDDLVRLTSIQNTPLELIVQPIKPGEVIDRVINECRSQLEQKNLSIQIDLDERLPELYADQDAFFQIIFQLMQNAIAASPDEGVIQLYSAFEGESSPAAHFLFQITDSGGGIDPADLPRIFSRRYRTDHAVIQGLGENGVGLSIAKTLVEAHNGRIWADTQVGKTTTFSILLPIRIKGEAVHGNPDETAS